MEKEAKKEAFRKYLESSGVLDALTKVLVALYEQNDKPSSAIELYCFKLFEDSRHSKQDWGRVPSLDNTSDGTSNFEEFKKSHTVASSKEHIEETALNDGH